MKKLRSPLPLTDYAMKPLVSLTFSTLRNLVVKSKANTKINLEDEVDEEGKDEEEKERKSREELLLGPLRARKRKLGATSVSFCLHDEGPKKRQRRRSFDSCQAVVKDEEEVLTKDDCFVQKCSIVDVVIILRNYLNCLPQGLWNNFFYLAIKELNSVQTDRFNVAIRAFELLFCKKCSSFSTRMLCYHVYEKNEKVIYERLRLCRNLRRFEVHYRINKDLEESLLCSLSKLNHLSAVTLLPNCKQSLHSVIPVISKHCQSLEEFSVTYNSEYMSSCENNIGCLQSCTKLKKLMLHGYGRGAEAQYITLLLYKLKNLKYFFHRELPHAITDIYSKCCKDESKLTLNLKVLLLAVYSKGVGAHLCYLPEESMLQIAKMCPLLTHLKLVRPSNLSIIAELIPSLSSLDLHDCDVLESFTICPQNRNLRTVSSLSLKNTEYIDFNCITLISICCPLLEELEISHSNLFWSTGLHQATSGSFSHLRKLTLLKVPNSEQTGPRFVLPKKLYVDRMLIRYLLSGANRLQELYLEFDLDSVRCRDSSGVPTEDDLTTCIGRCSELRELMLLSCPPVSYQMVLSLTESCPHLHHLWDIDLWQIPSNEMDKILRKFSYMFVQSYERSML